jgi:hypothetical protein
MGRLVGYGGDCYVAALTLEDCEDVWDESVDGDVTATLETTEVKVGSGSLKLVQAAGLANGDILATEVISVGDLSAYSIVFCWAMATVAITTADDYRLLLDNHANCASPDLQLSLPVLVANEWKYCQCPLVAGTFAAVSAGISIGIELNANDPGAATLYLDHIQAGKSIAGIRAWSLDVIANVEDTSSYQDGQTKVFEVTQKEWSGSFEGFKDGAPLAIGTVVGLELRESSTSTQQWRGTGIITAIRPGSSVSGMTMYSYDFQGIHGLEWPTT